MPHRASTRAPHATVDGTVDGAVAAYARETPAAVAVRANGRDHTYAELTADACRWAGLLRAAGVGPGDTVAVRLPREPRLVAVLLGVLRCGAGYLAVDPAWPDARVRQALARGGGPLVLDESDPGVGATELRVGRDPGREYLAESLSAPELTASVFFTSGSTGRPKAVLSPHRAAIGVLARAGYASFDAGCRMLAAAPAPWDAFSLELWGPLLNGGTAVLADDDPDLAGRLRRHIARDRVNTVWLTASVFNALTDDDPGSFTGLRAVLTGGERLSPEHVDRFLAGHPDIALTNGYGPCEATVFVSTHRLGPDAHHGAADVPLGVALSGVDIAVAAPGIGGVGEIVVGGVGLGHGYLGDPRATARAFVPAHDGRRRYRTGDLGWFDADGLLRYRGRLDRQLKIRGQRVEPEEVEEFVLGALPVSQVEVTGVPGPRGETVGLAVHVLPRHRGESTVDWWDRLSAAAAELPAYLRPQRLLVHDSFPLLANGKVDRAALTAKSRHRSRPATDTADGPWAVVVSAAAELDITVGADDDLFGAGLDSLTAIRLLARLHATGPRLLTPVDVFGERTPRRLGRLLESRRSAAPGTAPADQPATTVPRAVYEMWLYEQLNPGDEAALVVSAFHLDDPLDVERWQAAVLAVARRHPALGSVLTFDGERVGRAPCTPEQLAGLAAARPWPRGFTVRDGAVEIPAGVIEPFDLEEEPPWRWYLSTWDGRAVLLLVLHHTAVDGWSERLVLTDLGSAYRGAALEAPGAAPGAAPVGPAADAYWDAALAGASAPAVPAPRAGGPADHDAEPPVFVLTEDEVLAGRVPASPTPVQTLLLGCLGVALHDGAAPAAGTRHVVGVAYSGRDDATAHDVGLLVDILPIVLPAGGDPDFAEIDRGWLAAVAHRGSLSLSGTARRLRLTDDRARTPFTVAFALQSVPPAELDLGATTRRLPVHLAAPPFDVYVEAWPRREGGLSVHLQHDPRWVESGWAEKLARAFETAVRDAVAAHQPEADR